MRIGFAGLENYRRNYAASELASPPAVSILEQTDKVIVLHLNSEVKHDQVTGYMIDGSKPQEVWFESDLIMTISEVPFSDYWIAASSSSYTTILTIIRTDALNTMQEIEVEYEDS